MSKEREPNYDTDLMLVDGRPALFIEYDSDIDGDYLHYRHLGEKGFNWMRLNAMQHRVEIPKYRR